MNEVVQGRCGHLENRGVAHVNTKSELVTSLKRKHLKVLEVMDQVAFVRALSIHTKFSNVGNIDLR